MRAARYFLFFVLVIQSGFSISTSRTKRRVHLPFLGLGPYCRGCPSHFCDDDPAVVQGYCCGCASIFDRLPIVCPTFLKCPLNGKQLCDDYEYMMHCCCE